MAAGAEQKGGGGWKGIWDLSDDIGGDNWIATIECIQNELLAVAIKNRV